MSILLRDSMFPGSFGHHFIRTQLGTLFLLICWSSCCMALDVWEYRDELARSDSNLAEIRSDLQEIRMRSLDIQETLQKEATGHFPSASAHHIAQQARAEKNAEDRLLQAMRLVDKDRHIAQGGRGLRQLAANSTANSTANGQASAQSGITCRDGRACSALDRFIEDCLRHRAFVIVGLAIFLAIPLCSVLVQYRPKGRDDAMRGADDLDEVWFRKPEPGKPSRQNL
mmetsp:Transcript_123844/g.174646  ORF Transcript_123844/g.174646 Transcript_123844/m.174646 type:complete len:227 (+) Transcript_123844:37-717(+)|eukprot:s1681_g7.t1